MDTTRMLGSGDGYEADTQQEERGHNPLLVLHLLLQGRYMLAVVLAVILAAIAGVTGYKMTHQTFSCTGMIHIRPVISPLLFNGSGTMPMYEQFVKTQVVMLKNERCVDAAMNSPRWLDSGARANYDAVRFMKGLDVTNDGEIIRVVFTDPDPKTASDAVAALIDAYQQLTIDLDPDNTQRTITKLTELKGKYEKDLEEARQRVTEIAKPYTPSALENHYNYMLTDASMAETEWHGSQRDVEVWKLQHGIDPGLDAAPDTQSATTQTGETAASRPASEPATTAPAVSTAATTPGTMPAAASAPARAPAATVAAATAPATKPASTQPKVYTPEQIAGVDGTMRDLLDARRNAQSALEQLMLKVGPNHPLVQAARKQVDYYDDKVTDYAAHWKPLQDEGHGVPQVAATPQTVTLEQLMVKEKLDHNRFNSINNEANRVGANVTLIQSIQADQQQKIQWLAETKQKLEELNLALNNAGHISVLSNGDRPVLKDKRIPMAAATGFGGGILGFAVIIVWGLLDRRLRTIDQARMSLKQGMRVLGMLPSLPKNLEDPAAASFAALCVHHIRMLLQVMPRLDGHPAIAITSPSPGDGKTSLTMALALSYAASGKSTLLIDCDIVGAGLTRRVNAIIRRRIGQILIRENLLTAAELREALSAAQRTGRKLGEVLVDEGFVDAEQLAKALAQQSETSVGLLDVMRGEVLEDCVAETGTPRLWILPIGSALAEHGATISPEGFRSVLDQARKRFDVILVDTGPIPGAIESSVAASQVDGVVLTVSRGEQGPLVKRAADHLRDIGGRALGVVFNRASPEDFSSSYSSMSNPSIPERVREKAGADMSALGPVASAVAGHQRSLKEGKE